MAIALSKILRNAAQIFRKEQVNAQKSKEINT
jgi:hypothetical protein